MVEAAQAYPAKSEGYDPVTQAIRALEARVAHAVQDFERAKRDLETCTAALHALRLVPLQARIKRARREIESAPPRRSHFNNTCVIPQYVEEMCAKAQN